MNIYPSFTNIRSYLYPTDSLHYAQMPDEICSGQN